MQFESWNFKFVGIIFYKLTSVCSTVFTLFPWQRVDSSCHGGLSWNTPFVLTCGTEGIRVVRQQRKFWCWVMAWGHEGRWEPKGKPGRESDYKPHNWFVPIATLTRIGQGRKMERKEVRKRLCVRTGWHVQKLDLTELTGARPRVLDAQKRNWGERGKVTRKVCVCSSLLCSDSSGKVWLAPRLVLAILTNKGVREQFTMSQKGTPKIVG